MLKRIVFFILSLCIFVSIGHAIGDPSVLINRDGISDALPSSTQNDPGDVLANIIAFMISMTAVLSVIAITWASIQMVLAVGQDEKIKKARYMIIYAFIGLTLAGCGYAIVRFIGNIDFTII